MAPCCSLNPPGDSGRDPLLGHRQSPLVTEESVMLQPAIPTGEHPLLGVDLEGQERLREADRFGACFLVQGTVSMEQCANCSDGRVKPLLGAQYL